MQDTTDKPKLMDTASVIALPIALLWSLSFLATMYGTGIPLLSAVSSLLPLLSIWMLRRRLSDYRNTYRPVSWMHTMMLSLVACLLAGLLTDAVQYAYFVFLDNGRLLSNVATVMQSDDYQRAVQQMMPDVSIDQMQQVIQSMTIRDIMVEVVVFNILAALPTSLIATILATIRQPQGKREQ